MAVRVAATVAHPNVVCFTVLPDGVSRIELDGQAMPVPVTNPQRIVVVGDIGCRLSAGHGLYQECNNDSLWPLAQVARIFTSPNYWRSPTTGLRSWWWLTVVLSWCPEWSHPLLLTA